MNNNQQALQGPALMDFLQRARALLPEQQDNSEGNHKYNISDQERRAAVRELLETQAVAPREFYELKNLSLLWWETVSAEKACEVLDSFTPDVLQRLSAGEQLKVRIDLSMTALYYQLEFNREKGLQRLQQTANWINQLPVDIQRLVYDEEHYDYWAAWVHLAEGYGAWNLAEQGVEWGYQQRKADCANEFERIWLERITCINRARILRLKPAATELEKQQIEQRIWQQVRAAILQLNQLEFDPEACFLRWEHLARQLLQEEKGAPLLPEAVFECLQAAEEYFNQHENPPASPLIRTLRNVKSAKLLLKAHYLLGNWQEALTLVDKAWFNTEDDAAYRDNFGGLCLLVLEKTGHLDKAAPMALETMLHTRYPSAATALELALRSQDIKAPLQTPRTRALWHLIIGWSVIDPSMKSILDEYQVERPKIKAEQCFKKARAIAPDDAFIELLIDYTQGWRKASCNQWEEALPLLERAVAELPQLAMSNTLVKLWCARFAVLNKEEALARPWYLPIGGTWCYYSAQKLQDPDFLFEAQELSEKHVHVLPPEEARDKLALYYYEEALRRFDRCFESGKGVFTDCTTVDGYSELCLKLSELYCKQQRFTEAIALHQQCIALCSRDICDHYATLLRCQLEQNQDSEAALTTAEALWQLVQEYNYLHDYLPGDILVEIAQRLHQLNRPLEIIIWLERLQGFLERLCSWNQDDQNQEPGYRLAAIRMLMLLQQTYPEQAQTMLAVHQQAIEQRLADDEPIKAQCQLLLKNAWH